MSSASKPRLKIAIIEDGEDILTLYNDFLISRDHEVISSLLNGDNIMSNFIRNFPDIVIMDYRMDGHKNVIDAALRVAEKSGENKFKIDLDDIKVEEKAGGSISDSQLIQGIILDKEVVHSGMPKRIQDAKIALINSALEIEKTEFDAKLNISSPDQMQKFLSEEERMLKSMVDEVISSGANVVLCHKGIDDLAQHYLAKAGIIAVRRIKESDMAKLAKATGGRIVSNIDELSEGDIGLADLIEERKVEADKWVFIEGCKNPKSITILIRGGSQRVVDEAERSIHDALMAVKDVVEYPYVVVEEVHLKQLFLIS